MQFLDGFVCVGLGARPPAGESAAPLRSITLDSHGRERRRGPRQGHLLSAGRKFGGACARPPCGGSAGWARVQIGLSIDQNPGRSANAKITGKDVNEITTALTAMRRRGPPSSARSWSCPRRRWRGAPRCVRGGVEQPHPGRGCGSSSCALSLVCEAMSSSSTLTEGVRGSVEQKSRPSLRCAASASRSARGSIVSESVLPQQRRDGGEVRLRLVQVPSRPSLRRAASASRSALGSVISESVLPLQRRVGEEVGSRLGGLVRVPSRPFLLAPCRRRGRPEARSSPSQHGVVSARRSGRGSCKCRVAPPSVAPCRRRGRPEVLSSPSRSPPSRGGERLGLRRGREG